MILIIILVILFFGGGIGYYGHRQWGENNGYAGPGLGVGTIVVILLLCWALGLFGGHHIL